MTPVGVRSDSSDSLSSRRGSSSSLASRTVKEGPPDRKPAPSKGSRGRNSRARREAAMNQSEANAPLVGRDERAPGAIDDRPPDLNVAW